MKLLFTVLIIVFLVPNGAFSQDSLEIAYAKQYEENIKKSRINGVYIPNNLEEAFHELKALSTPESIHKFKLADEEMVVRKLHFGLGRWMIYNWNFYDGSRFSDYLKQKGLSHPDDMARFVMICFHRYLNDQALEEEVIIQKISEERMNYLMENDILWKPGIKRDTLRPGDQ